MMTGAAEAAGGGRAFLLLVGGADGLILRQRAVRRFRYPLPDEEPERQASRQEDRDRYRDLGLNFMS